MNTSSNAYATARRNLAQRIDRVVWTQEALPSPSLRRWQADLIFLAIELLDGGHLADGEYAMMKAEKASIFEPAGYVAPARHGARQLLARLDRVLAG